MECMKFCHCCINGNVISRSLANSYSNQDSNCNLYTGNLCTRVPVVQVNNISSSQEHLRIASVSELNQLPLLHEGSSYRNILGPFLLLPIFANETLYLTLWANLVPFFTRRRPYILVHRQTVKRKTEAEQHKAAAFRSDTLGV